MADPEADEAVGDEEQGGPEVPHCSFLSLHFSGQRQVLKHLLTGEEIDLMQKLPLDAMGLPRRPDGRWALVFEDGLAVLWFQNNRVCLAKYVLSHVVFDNKGKFFTKCLATDVKTWLPQDCSVPPSKWISIGLDTSIAKPLLLKWHHLQDRALGASWWVELKSFHAWCPLGSAGTTAQITYNVARSLKTMAARLELSAHACVLNGDWMGNLSRWKPTEHDVVSSTGLLLLLIHRVAKTREGTADQHQNYKAAFQGVVMKILDGHSFAFKVTERINVFTDVTSQGRPSNHVQFNVVDGKLLFDDAPDVLHRAPWLTLLKKVIGPGFDNDDGTPVDAVLLALSRAKGTRWDCLLAQLVVNLGRYVDYVLPNVPSDQDDVAAQVQTPALDCADAIDELAMAVGVNGAQTFNPADLSKHAVMLGRAKSFRARDRWRGIAIRYFLAGRKVFEKCTKFSQTVDASRFKQDSFEGLMGGLVDEGNDEDLAFIVQWSPPQAQKKQLKTHLNVVLRLRLKRRNTQNVEALLRLKRF